MPYHVQPMSDPPFIPPYVREIEDIARALELTPRQPRVRSSSPLEPVMICVVHNEIRRLPKLLDHYRGLGVRDFLIIDNASTDGTGDWLAQQDDVTLYAMPGPFRWPLKQAWIHRAIQQSDPEAWYLVVDADELVVFEGHEQHRLPALVRELEARRISRARGVLIDLYPEGPLVSPGAEPTRAPHCWFDPDSYRETEVPRMVSCKGGPRHRVFELDGEPLAPELTKYPLFRAQAGHIMANPHHHFPYAENFQSPCLLGILHEKFCDDFPARVADAVRRKQYWDNSSEYQAYANALEKNPELSMWYPGSRRYDRPEDLLRCGLIEAVGWPTAG